MEPYASFSKSKMRYSVEDAKLWTIDLCNDIKTAVKEQCNVPRYKIMCQVPFPTASGAAADFPVYPTLEHERNTAVSYIAYPPPYL